jgi:hypothetical protein
MVGEATDPQREETMSTMADIIAATINAHGLTTGMQVASGHTCRCGYWNGEEVAGVTRPAGMYGLTWHQAQMVAEELTKAGYGSIREARDQRDRELHRFGYNWSLDQPPRASYPVDDYECCASGSCEVCRPGLHRGGDS